MRSTLLVIALAATGVVPALAAEPYYNPSNAASSSRLTTGHELFRTIGCPGKQLLDAPCQVSVPAAPKAATPVEPRDGDKDGVPDAADQCPTTPADRKVNAQGCELDGDRDGVVDALDRCPTTPAGRKVDANGCELDGDKDGVVDAADQCPATPAGRKVNAQGCEPDGDNDGVVDVLDRCPTTPAGRKVDASGCEPDGDKDGVADAVDQCQTTPAGDKVDARGCTLLNTINLKGVVFNVNSDVLRPESFAILDNAAETLKRYDYPMTEVAGHTDSRGDDALNQRLSERRAQTVRKYLVEKGCPADRLTAKGYGETSPASDNATEAGRLENRRVELRIQH